MSRTLNLALQGGGAHGAYTWGVLDALLAESDLLFEGISGTSAGAMNALCVGQGLMTGGREGARRVLRDFWTAVAESSPFSGGGDARISPALKLMLQWTDHLSPEQLNPLDLNPLRDILQGCFDFERLRQECPVKLFLAATHANSGKLRVFRNPELSVDVLLASACLPTIHRTIHIDGEPYWDGGYSANPAVFPLIDQCTAEDILLVLLTPLHYAETPASASDIRQRLRELAFNSTFLREMRMLAHVREQVGDRQLPGWLQRLLPVGGVEARLQALRFHAIDAQHVLGTMPSESKLAVNLDFFEQLREAGEAQAQRWLSEHSSHVGHRATLDLDALFY